MKNWRTKLSHRIDNLISTAAIWILTIRNRRLEARAAREAANPPPVKVTSAMVRSYLAQLESEEEIRATVSARCASIYALTAEFDAEDQLGFLLTSNLSVETIATNLAALARQKIECVEEQAHEEKADR